MKIILSRKGFDSSNGGCPSPILPDGTLLSLPIPSKHDYIKYVDLHRSGKSFFEIIKEINPRTRIKEHWRCHLDPDIRDYGIVEDWLPCSDRKARLKTSGESRSRSGGHIPVLWMVSSNREYRRKASVRED